MREDNYWQAVTIYRPVDGNTLRDHADGRLCSRRYAWIPDSNFNWAAGVVGDRKIMKSDSKCWRRNRQDEECRRNSHERSHAVLLMVSATTSQERIDTESAE